MGLTPDERRERARAAALKWRNAHREQAIDSARAWRAANPEKHRAAVRRWNEANPDRARAKRQAWTDANRSHLAVYKRERLAIDENFRIRTLLAKALHCALVHHRSGQNWRPDAMLRGIVGCSKPDLIAHIEALFQPGMSWANYGRKGWEIDHIKPCASFDLTQHDQMLACFYFTNLRPLWRTENNRRARKE